VIVHREPGCAALAVIEIPGSRAGGSARPPDMRGNEGSVNIAGEGISRLVDSDGAGVANPDQESQGVSVRILDGEAVAGRALRSGGSGRTGRAGSTRCAGVARCAFGSGRQPLRGRPRIAGGYRAETAQERAARLAVKPRVARKLVVGSALFGQVVEHLRRGLSPEQIAFTLGSMDEPVRLSHETIYTALYAMPRGQLRARIRTAPGSGGATRIPTACCGNICPKEKT
jgi:hypothetical protein